MDDMIFDEAQIRLYFGNGNVNEVDRQAKEKEYRWTNGVIPFEFEVGYPEDKKKIVLCYLQQFNQCTLNENLLIRGCGHEIW